MSPAGPVGCRQGKGCGRIGVGWRLKGLGWEPMMGDCGLPLRRRELLAGTAFHACFFFGETEYREIKVGLVIRRDMSVGASGVETPSLGNRRVDAKLASQLPRNKQETQIIK